MSAQSLAHSLQDAQLHFWLQELTPARLETIIREETAYLYQQLDQITLVEAVDAGKIKATAHRYALEMEIGGGIPELFGEIANIVYEHPAQDNTLIGDIFAPGIVQEFLEKLFEDGGAVDRTLRNIQRSEPFKLFLGDVVFLTLKGYLLEQNSLITRLPRLASGLRRLRTALEDRLPMLPETLEENTRLLLERSINNTLKLLDGLLDHDLYRDEALNATLNLWDEIRRWPVARFRDYTSESDLQEWMVLGYEFWREFRETDYLTGIIDTAVDFFFDKYGDDSLQKIISEMGVTYEMVESEILRYSDDLARLAIDKGIAETLIRRHLERFYSRPETLALLEAALNPPVQPE